MKIWKKLKLVILGIFLNTPFEGPFSQSKEERIDTIALSPFSTKKFNELNMNSHLVRHTDPENWKRAHTFKLQFAKKIITADDDWNLCWKEKFDNYNFLDSLTFPNVLEVGCGPHTNIKFIFLA